MTWFETLTGFSEQSPILVRENMAVDGEVLKSHVNGKVMVCGQLEIPSLAELRERVLKSGSVELDIVIVSYGSSKPYIQKLVNQYR